MEVGVGSWFRASESGVGERPAATLALDTSTDRAVVALARADGEILIAAPTESRKHGRGLVVTIRDLLADACLGVHDIAAIGVGLGPGSFTGLRIGVTAAKTLAYAVGCPLYGFDSLEAIARNAPGEFLRINAVGDAQRGDLFVAAFVRDAVNGPLRRIHPTRLERLETWPALLEPGTIVLGSPLGRAEPEWPPTTVRGDADLGYPVGPVLIEMTREQMNAEAALDPWFLEPSYVRRSAAEEKAWPTGGPQAAVAGERR